MPSLAPRRVAAVAVAALSIPLLACGGKGNALLVAAKSPINVSITCTDGVSVGLTDAAGNSAWAVALKKNDDIEWLVEDNIPSIVISQKVAGAWPLDSITPTGSKKGKPAKAKVKDDAQPGKYAYKIEALCQRPDSTTIKVTIDPDMILLQGMDQ